MARRLAIAGLVLLALYFGYTKLLMRPSASGRGDRVRISGALVAIKRADGASMGSSSLTRDDTGNGACEIVWVDEIQIGDAVYR